MSKLGNEPAFLSHSVPVQGSDGRTVGDLKSYGLTKREYFAAMAMQGVVSSPNAPFGGEKVVVLSVQYADALLAELERTK